MPMLPVLIASLILPQGAPASGESDFAREVYDNLRRQIPPTPSAEAIVLPVDPRHAEPSRTAAWLAGWWATTKAQCYGGDFGLSFTADGRFTDYWFSGRFRIRGERLHQRVEELTDAAEPGDRVGQRFSRKLRLLGPNELLLGDNSHTERFFRCPEGGLKD